MIKITDAARDKFLEITEAEDPKLGDTKNRGILLEAMSATCLLVAGADVLIMRHPEAIRLVKEMVTELTAS